MPAGGLAVERCLKEYLSNFDKRAECPLTNLREFKASGVDEGSHQRRFHKGDIRCLPRFLTEAPPAARG